MESIISLKGKVYVALSPVANKAGAYLRFS